jgi:hypothetical protein
MYLSKFWTQKLPKEEEEEEEEEGSSIRIIHFTVSISVEVPKIISSSSLFQFLWRFLNHYPNPFGGSKIRIINFTHYSIFFLWSFLNQNRQLHTLFQFSAK